MLGEGFSNPTILPLICAYQYHQAIARGIVAVKEVCDNPDEA